MSQLPKPVTVQDMYLAAILNELQAIRAQGETETAISPPTTNIVNIREPEVAPEPVGTPIPDGFPGRDALFDAGITTVERIPHDGDSLVEIKGIGKVTAGQILAELS